MRRLALVTDAIFPYHRGGKEIRYHELAARLARRAHVDVYTMKWWGDDVAPRSRGVTYRAISPLVPLYARNRRSIVQALVFALACLRLLVARFDVLEADHMPYLQLLPLRLVATLRRKRLVVTWHEFWGPEYWATYMGRPGRVGWWVERLAMRLPDAIIAASEATAARVRHWVPDRVEVAVAPNGIDVGAIETAPASADRSDLIVVSRLLEHKRIGMLIEALGILRDRGVDFTCRVVGDGPLRPRLLAHARALEVDDRVTFLHDVGEQRELYSLLKASRVFVFPSAREGFGIAVLEALACGLPVVTTSAPDNLAQHLVARSGRGAVSAPSPGALADAIANVAGSGGAEAPEPWLREYDWDAIAERVAGVMLR
jgi:glycosyltransferase involved in cell wall biosynthesis